ncbi:hypothetical protein Nepgr_009380 [Nepenthes gracilis]|uniref:Uncharacterized protein n=1 Tax=Nepenthes gracilis TaxID=150966 RepID=A0AAD3SAX5_NEPGR|nr:hypothetical protein Nepgr_009380 [Nepenthes gracilis]
MHTLLIKRPRATLQKHSCAVASKRTPQNVASIPSCNCSQQNAQIQQPLLSAISKYGFISKDEKRKKKKLASLPAASSRLVLPSSNRNKPKGLQQSSHRAASTVYSSIPFDILQSDESTEAPGVTDDIKQQLDSSCEQLSCMNLAVSSMGNIHSFEMHSVSPSLEKSYSSGNLCSDDLPVAVERGCVDSGPPDAPKKMQVQSA